MADTSLPFNHAHFVGIGGAGMSGIAKVLHERGCQVTGSDLKESRYVRDLRRSGVEVTIGHEAATIDSQEPDVIVTSTAIPDTNPEVVRAKELDIPIWPRAKMLAALGAGRKTVAVAGTHGKTTTSSMVATMLDAMGLDPSFLIGGIVEGYRTNGRNGEGDLYVAEADESDASFLLLDPSIVVVTNIEADHLDHYGSLGAIEEAFSQFMSSVGPDGTVIVCGENPHVPELARQTGRTTLTYGFGGQNDIVCAPRAQTHKLASTVDITLPNGQVVAVTIKSNPGAHNQLNATAAIAVAWALGLDCAKAAEALSTFSGVRRRFTHVGDIDNICVVDDYGHHPTEVEATLKAAAGLDFDRVVVAFQPHRYSRTQALAHQFGQAFSNADVLLVMDVFSAGEMPIPGISGKTVATAVEESGQVGEVRYVAGRSDIVPALMELVRPGDLVITMGAGDVTMVGPEFIEAMQERDAASE